MKQARVLSDADLKRVLALLDIDRYSARNRLAIMLSYLAGLRVGEIAALKISDVYTAGGETRDQFVLDGARTKTKESRTIFIGTKLRKELVRYRRTIVGSLSLELPLLRSQKGTAFSPNTLCQLLIAVHQRAGINDATSHSGRRTFISKLAHRGVSPKVIMELAGHKHLSTTQRYIEVNDEMKRAAIEVL